MIGILPVGSLEQAVISGRALDGFSIQTRSGKRLQMALVDEHGNIVEKGRAVANETWNVAINAYKAFLHGKGHLRVYYDPPTKLST